MSGEDVDGGSDTGGVSGVVVIVVGDVVAGTAVAGTNVGRDVVGGEVEGGESKVGARDGAGVSLAVASSPNVLEASSRVSVLLIMSVNGIIEYHSSLP